RTTALTWSQVLTRVPPIDRIRSPGRSPALLAGATGSLAVQAGGVVAPAVCTVTHWETELICGVYSRMPYVVATPASSTTAMSRFIVGPPSMMTSFFGTDSL